jgi:hypothetical protein
LAAIFNTPEIKCRIGLLFSNIAPTFADRLLIDIKADALSFSQLFRFRFEATRNFLLQVALNTKATSLPIQKKPSAQKASSFIKRPRQSLDGSLNLF